jgi:hypothetical protein
MYVYINIYLYVYNVYIYVGIMDLHNGQIFVTSDGEGKGCAFTVKIPMLLKVPIGPMSSPTSSLPRPSFLHLSDSKMLMSPRDIEISAPELVSKTISIDKYCPSFEVDKTKTLPPLEVLVVDDSNLNR